MPNKKYLSFKGGIIKNKKRNKNKRYKRSKATKGINNLYRQTGRGLLSALTGIPPLPIKGPLSFIL